jgi:hypothetical protein
MPTGNGSGSRGPCGAGGDKSTVPIGPRRWAPRMKCEDAQQQMCRLAAGSSLPDRGFGLARHARWCPGCRGFADTLARIRSWLASPRPPVPTPDELVHQARRALARELAARLARDLVGLVEGRRFRPVHERQADIDRLVVLEGEQILGADPWPGLLPCLTGAGAAPDRARALDLALRLDPVAVDLALMRMAQLVHTGHEGRADEEADRILQLIG